MTSSLDIRHAAIPIPTPIRKPRGVDPTTTEIIYGPEEFELIRAMQAYQADNARPAPTLAETLSVFKGLGYSKGQPQRLTPSDLVEEGDTWIRFARHRESTATRESE